jgi:acetyl esterase/lipase
MRTAATVKRAVLIFITTGLFAGACTTVKPETAVPYTEYCNVSYGEDVNQKFDMSVPKVHDGTAHVFLFIHGGSLLNGDKNTYPRYLDKYRENHIFVTMNYRFVNKDVHVDDILLDVDETIKTIKNTAEDRGIVPKKLIIMGHSAGAQLSLLYSYKYFNQTAIPIAFCIGTASPADFTDPNYYSMAKNKLGNFKEGLKTLIQLGALYTGKVIQESDIATDDLFDQTVSRYFVQISPVYFVSGNCPPTILVHDTSDKTVPYSNAIGLRSALNVLNVPNVLISSTNNLGHNLGETGDNWSISSAHKETAPWIPRLIHTIDEYMGLYCN